MLIKQTLLYLPAQFFGPLFQFVSVIVWTHWLAPEEMGIFALATVSAEIAFLLSLSWFSQYSLRYYPEKGQERARRDYRRAETTIVLLAGALHVIAAIWLAQIFTSPHSTFALAGAISAYFITRTLDAHLGERARADQHILAYTILQTAGPVVGLFAGILLLEFMQQGVVSVLFGYAIPQLVAALVAMGMIGVSLKPRWPDRALMEPALRYGLPLIGAAALAWFAEHAIRYIVEYRLGSAALGLLSVGWGLGLRTSAFAAMLVSAAAFPLASKMLIAGKRDDALGQLRINAALLLAVLIPSLVGLWAISPQLIDLVIAEQYRAMTAQILPFALIVGGARHARFHITDQMFILDRNFCYSVFVNVVDIVISLAAIFVGLALHGVVGAAEGAVVGAVAASLTSLAIAVFRSGFRYPFTDVARIAIAATAMALVLQAVVFPSSYFGLALAIAVGAAVYVAAMAILFPQERKMVADYARTRFGMAGA